MEIARERSRACSWRGICDRLLSCCPPNRAGLRFLALGARRGHWGQSSAHSRDPSRDACRVVRSAPRPCGVVALGDELARAAASAVASRSSKSTANRSAPRPSSNCSAIVQRMIASMAVRTPEYCSDPQVLNTLRILAQRQGLPHPVPLNRCHGLQEHVIEQSSGWHEFATASPDKTDDPGDSWAFQWDADQPKVTPRRHRHAGHDTKAETCFNQAHQRWHVLHLAEPLRLVLHIG